MLVIVSLFSLTLIYSLRSLAWVCLSHNLYLQLPFPDNLTFLFLCVVWVLYSLLLKTNENDFSCVLLLVMLHFLYFLSHFKVYNLHQLPSQSHSLKT